MNSSIHPGTAGVTAKMGKWQDDESNMLRQAVQLLGDKHWTDVSKWLAGKNIHRHPTQCRHRWHKTMMPNLKKGHWDDHENELLRNAVKQQAANTFENTTVDWEGVARQVPGRTGKACRERWISRLDPRINKAAFTSEEEKTLMQLHQQFKNKWASIAKQMPGRTADAVKSKYISIMRRQQKNGSRKRLLGEPSQSPPKRRHSPVCGSTGSAAVGTAADAEGDMTVTRMMNHTLSNLGIAEIRGKHSSSPGHPHHHHHHEQQQQATRLRPAHSLDMGEWLGDVPGSISQLSPMGSLSVSSLSFGSSTPSPMAGVGALPTTASRSTTSHHQHIHTALATLDSINPAGARANAPAVGGFLDMLTAKHVEPLVLSDDMPVIKPEHGSMGRSTVLLPRPVPPAVHALRP
jgi:hypothetical protein